MTPDPSTAIPAATTHACALASEAITPTPVSAAERARHRWTAGSTFNSVELQSGPLPPNVVPLTPRRKQGPAQPLLAKLTPELAILAHLAAVLDRRDRAEGRTSTVLYEVVHSLIADEGVEPQEHVTQTALNTACHFWDRMAAEAVEDRAEDRL